MSNPFRVRRLMHVHIPAAAQTMLQPLMFSHYEFPSTASVGDTLATVGPFKTGTTPSVDDPNFSLSVSSDPRIWNLKLAAGSLSAPGSLTVTENDAGTINTTSYGYRVFTPATTATVTASLGSTDKAYLRAIASWLDGIPEENDITVTITGQVKLCVWPWRKAENQFGTGTLTLVKRELYPEDPWTSVAILQTSGATVGSNVGQMVFSAKNNRNETGSTVTCTLNISVDNTVALTWVHGGLNKAGHGGFDLTQLGNATDWTITSQSTANLFDIWNGAKVSATNDQNWQRVAFKGTYNATPTVSSPPGSATVTVNSVALGQSWTLTATIDPVCYTFCPRVGIDGAANEQWLTAASVTHYFGMRIIAAPGTYFGQTCSLSATTVTSHATTPSIVAPTGPYNERDNWSPNGVCTIQRGWITLYAEKPDSIAITNAANVSNSRSSAYLRMTGWPATAYLNNNRAWFMYDHASPNAAAGATLNWGGDNSNCFARDVYMYSPAVTSHTSSGGSVTVCGTDSQLVGVFWDGVQDTDNSSSLLWNPVPGRKRSAFAWTFGVNKQSFGAAHVDYWQPAILGDRYHDTTVVPAGSTVDYADVFGNMPTLGNPSLDSSTPPKLQQGSQNFFLGNSGGTTHRSDITHRVRWVGNAIYEISFYGMIFMPNITAGTIITQNAINFDWGVANGFITRTGYAAGGPANTSGWLSRNQIFYDPLAANGSITVSRNYHSIVLIDGFFFSLDASCVQGADNYSITRSPLLSASLTWAQAQFQNATIGNGTQTPALYQAALEPVVGSVMLTTTTGKVMGPFGPKGNRLVDHRRRKVYPEALVA